MNLKKKKKYRITLDKKGFHDEILKFVLQTHHIEIEGDHSI